MLALSRRSFLTGPLLAAGCAALPVAGRAAALTANAQGPGVYRYKLGDFQLTALYDGIWYLPIDDKFVRNASGAAVNEAFAAAFLAPSILPISFTALLVNTGAKLVLIDTGTAGQITDSAGFMKANLAAAGITPSAIDTIIISHFYPDHIDGIKTKDDDKVFANAEILVPEPEWKFWMDDGNMSRATRVEHRYFWSAAHVGRFESSAAASGARSIKSTVQPTVLIFAGRVICLACFKCPTCFTWAKCFRCLSILAMCLVVLPACFTLAVVVDLAVSAFAAGLLMLAGPMDVPWASAGPAIRLTAMTAVASLLNMDIILINRVAANPGVARPTGISADRCRKNAPDPLNPR